MSKWNKPTPTPNISPEFLQNQERRKEMIIEAARRRREKEKKREEQQRKERKDSQEALSRHKQEKKDAYVKYLRNNIHDKYEEAKRKKKEVEEQIRPTAKWGSNSRKKEGEKREESVDKNDSCQKRKDEERGLSGLDLEVNMKENNKKKDLLREQFEREWMAQSLQGQDELLGSNLLDSLDLQVGSGRKRGSLAFKAKQKPKAQLPIPAKQQVDKLRQLIGYESVVIQKQPKTSSVQSKPAVVPVKKTKPTKPEVNQVQAFNQLKRKKEAKIMNWAIQQEQEAQDLFSNCSSRKPTVQALKQLNQQLKSNNNKIRNNPHNLATISEEKAQGVSKTGSTPAVVNRAAELQKIQQQRKNRIAERSRQAKQERSVSRDRNKQEPKPPKSAAGRNDPSKEIKQAQPQNKTVAAGFGGEKNMIRMRTTSREARGGSRQKIQEAKKEEPFKRKAEGYSSYTSKSQKSLKSQNQPHQQAPLPPLPSRPDPAAAAYNNNNSLATYDIGMGVDSFLKNDLLNLNNQQAQLQQQLRQIHIQHKGQLNEVYQKYQVKTDYQHSGELTGEEVREGYGRRVNQGDIQESIQNLDHLLIRRQLGQRQKKSAFEEEDSKSFINPFSQSEDLCAQVLQLAKNVSRFESTEPVDDGYLVKKKPKTTIINKEQANSYSRSKEVKEEQSVRGPMEQSQVQSEQVSKIIRVPPPVIEASPEEKIHVNAKLLKGLLLDDD